jgi:hypothetical protein
MDRSMVKENPERWPEELFKAAQQPHAWLSTAEQLAAAAELILQDQVRHEVPYFRAHEAASQEALAVACASPNDGAGSAEIKCEPPNYLPAQLLYAFALENVLKGLLIAKNPSLAGEHKLNRQITSHNLVKLAEKAGFDVAGQELPLLESLSEIAVWAGRYPVAIELKKPPRNSPLSDPHILLDYGAHHPTMRRVFKRAVEELEKKLSRARCRFGVVVVFPPKLT